jgi:hypothetical protein
VEYGLGPQSPCAGGPRVPPAPLAGLLAWLAALVADTALAHPVPQVLILAFGAGFSERLIVNQPEARG